MGLGLADSVELIPGEEGDMPGPAGVSCGDMKAMGSAARAMGECCVMSTPKRNLGVPIRIRLGVCGVGGLGASELAPLPPVNSAAGGTKPLAAGGLAAG